MTEEDILKRVDKIIQNNTKQQEIRRTAVKVNEFIKGNQWIAVGNDGRVAPIERDEDYFKKHRKYRPRPVVQMLFGIYRTYFAYLLKTQGKFKGSPESLDDVLDIIGARIATKFIEYLYQSLVVDGLDMELYNMIIVWGTAFTYQFWNKRIKASDMICIPPSQIYPYPTNVKSWQDVREFVWLQRVATDVLQEEYPDVEITASPDSASGDILAPLDKNEQYPENDYTVVAEYWKLPTQKSEGCMARIAGPQSSKKFLFGPTKKYPYKIKSRKGETRFSLTEYFDNYTGSGLWGFSTMSQGLALQEALNDGKSAIQRMREIFPKMLIDKATRIDPETMQDPDADYLEYEGRMGKQPTFSTVPQPSGALITDVMDTKREIENATLLHQVTLEGRAPGAIQSGYGVERLQSGDELRLLPALKWILRGHIISFENLYQLNQQYLKNYPEKLKKILGEMGEIDILSFKDIELIPMNFTIDPTAFSPFAQERRQQKIASILPYGLIRTDDPHERRIALDYFDKDMAADIDVLSREARLQKMENKLMLEGEHVEVNNDDQDEIHIDEMNVIRKDFRYRNFKEKIKKEFEYHFEAHRKQLDEKTEQARAAMREDMQRAQPQQAQRGA